MGSMQETDITKPHRRLLVTVIEEKARLEPNDAYIRYAPADWETNGYRSISWKQSANAIDKVAYFLDKKLGTTNEPFVIGYFGPNDARYAILIAACIKTGKPLLIVDGRVTHDGLNSLITKTNCKAWLYAEDDPVGPLVKPDSGLPTLAIPSLEWMLQAENQRHYPYEKTFEQEAWKDIIIIHTSGTTGLPKPIRQNNGFWANCGEMYPLSQKVWPQGLDTDEWGAGPCIAGCPPQWIVGVFLSIVFPIYFHHPSILLPTDVTILTPRNFQMITRMNRVHSILCPPPTIISLYEDPESRSQLKSLKYIGCVGAALDRTIGDDLCKFTRLVSMIGSTETGPQWSKRLCDRALWYSNSFVEEMDCKMEPVDTEDPSSDLYELVLERSKDDTMPSWQGAWWNPDYKDLTRIESKELYCPIKDSDGSTRWIFKARKDDLLKLSWLAKFHAEELESRIMHHPLVRGVLVGGEGRFSPFVLVELKPGVLDMSNEQQLIDEIYQSVIADTNKATVKEVRITKETLLIAKTEKPFQRTLKQSIMRKAVEQDYSVEIESAYSKLQ